MQHQHDGYFFPVLIHATPRSTRLDVPGVPQHVIQRGNDRQPCFFADADYLRYRSDLREVVKAARCMPMC
jgi:REP element-mobilizing transposase RayT